MTRKNFLQSMAAAVGFGGCGFGGGGFGGGEEPRLKLGVVSDIHVTTPESADAFRKALREFRARGADAVMVAGDLSDWGLRSGFKSVKDAWDAELGGTDIVPLFITGNHDFDGFWYGDMTLDMHVQGYSEDEALVRTGGMKAGWEEIFREPYADIRRRTVKGFDFISAEWQVDGKGENDAAIAQWLSAHASELKGERPFFFFRHSPVPNTVSSSKTEGENPLYRALCAFPNCVAFSGHTHRTFFDEGSAWQGVFTAISIPSMSYASSPKGYENGSDSRKGDSTRDMQPLPSRVNLEDAQGYFVSVHADRLKVGRLDFTAGDEAEPWIVPLDAGRSFAKEARARRSPAPQFPAGARVRTHVTNADTRNGHWTIFLMLEFPSATATEGRAFDYEVRVVSEKDGRTLGAKRYLSPACYKPASCEPKEQSFRFNAMDVPETGRYRFAVVPRDSFGNEGRPLVSKVFESKPGKAKAKNVPQQ